MRRAIRSRAIGVPMLLALCGGVPAAFDAHAAAPGNPPTSPTSPTSRQAPSWGAIAAKPGAHGYAFNQNSRATAERLARAQCDQAAGRAGAAGTCEVRAYFDRSCGALATGNFGEWGAAYAATADAAGKAAVAQCDSHLPTEPCKLAVSVCSLP